MKTAKISSRFQIVIPKRIRQASSLKPGESLQVTISDNCIQLRRARGLERLYGIAKGMEWKDAYRE